MKPQETWTQPFGILEKHRGTGTAGVQIAGMGRLFWWALLHGLATSTGMHLTFVVSEAATDLTEDVIRMALILAVMIIVLVSWLYRRVLWPGMLAYSVLFSVGLVVWYWLWLFLQHDLGVSIPVFRRPGLAKVQPGTIELFLAAMCCCWLAWGLCRWRYGRIVVQDGTKCPNCTYSLVGCVERVCPECGRGFTFQELGTTREEFERHVRCNAAGAGLSDQPAATVARRVNASAPPGSESSDSGPEEV